MSMVILSIYTQGMDIRPASILRSVFVTMLLTMVVASAQAVAYVGENAVTPASVASVEVSVLYVTNRQRALDQRPEDAYTGERGKPHFGHCEVEFTPIPIINQLAAKVPFYVPSETNKLQHAEQADEDAFWDHLTASSKQTSSGSVVLFVHGYNYGFERTCRMASELQRALQGKATVVMFSWPSNGRPTDYMPDQADVEWSVPFLANVLAQLGERIGRNQVQVLAHSLGSRGAIFALERLSAERIERPLIGSLVLVAPDFDAEAFVERLPRLTPLANGITLYASSNDTALKASHQLHFAPRLGEAGEFLTVAEGMQTIDVSPPGRYQILGHEYFYYQPQVSADLVELLSTGKSAAERSGLRAKNRNGLTYWEVTSDSVL